MAKESRLVLPKPMMAKLASLGIYCQTWVTAERQDRAKRWVLRGVESGGSAKEFGRYISFFAADGSRMEWLQKTDRIGANGVYLPMARWTGELQEYMARSRERQAGDNGFTVLEDQLVRSEVPADWLRGLQSYTLRWVARHRDQWTARGVTVEGEDVPSVETQAVGLR